MQPLTRSLPRRRSKGKKLAGRQVEQVQAEERQTKAFPQRLQRRQNSHRQRYHQTQRHSDRVVAAAQVEMVAHRRTPSRTVEAFRRRLLRRLRSQQAGTRAKRRDRDRTRLSFTYIA